MPITYDKKALKRFQKYLKMGKKKYALKIAFFSSIFQAIFLSSLLTLIDKKFEIVRFLILFFATFIFQLITTYISFLKQWDGMVSTYKESIEYFKKNNPEFIADMIEQNPIDNK